MGPLNGFAIDFENYDSNMDGSILLDVVRLTNVLKKNGDIFDGSDNLQSNEKLNKNILKYAMSFAKEMELFENGKLLTVTEYKNKFADPSTLTSGDIKRIFVENTIK